MTLHGIFMAMPRPRFSFMPLCVSICQRKLLHFSYSTAPLPSKTDQDGPTYVAQVILPYLDSCKIDYQYHASEHKGYCYIQTCPNCAKEAKSPLRRFSLNISPKGAFSCTNCRIKGQWSDFQTLYSQAPRAQDTFKVSGSASDPWFESHGISSLTLNRMAVNVSGSRISFSEYSPILHWEENTEGNILECTSCHDVTRSGDSFQGHKISGPSTRRGIFGLSSTIGAPSTGSLMIVRDELDALAIEQYTNFPCISIPWNDDRLPSHVISFLDRFSKFYLWIPDGQIVNRVAMQLGKGKCMWVKQPGDSLRPWAAREQCKDIITKYGQSFVHNRIHQFSRFKDQVREEYVNHQALQGVQSLTLPSLNRILKGHRPGELTVLTGPTGSGKTSILSQLSLDYCSQGLGTLWGSFEIPTQRLIKKMIRQYSDIDFSKDMSDFEHWSDKFLQLPMYFMDFFGSCPLEEVLEAMNYAVDANNVKHVILDNLQFMLSGQERGNFDKWDMMDRSVSRIRQFATFKNVHVTLVIHPRKENDDTALGISSVTGTSKATQEADNVVILQRMGKKRFLEVKKNRYDGELGRIYYKYDPVSTKIYETDTVEGDTDVLGEHITEDISQSDSL